LDESNTTPEIINTSLATNFKLLNQTQHQNEHIHTQQNGGAKADGRPTASVNERRRSRQKVKLRLLH